MDKTFTGDGFTHIMSTLNRETNKTEQAMTNKNIFEILLERTKEDIDFKLDQGDTLEQAKAYAKERSTAGWAVWEAIDKHYS